MRNAKEGTYNDAITFCPTAEYGSCPYCDQCNICHIEDPQAECDDWQAFWESWDEWLNTPEEESEPDYDWGYNEDEGFDPYAGGYTWDC